MVLKICLDKLRIYSSFCRCSIVVNAGPCQGSNTGPIPVTGFKNFKRKKNMKNLFLIILLIVLIIFLSSKIINYLEWKFHSEKEDVRITFKTFKELFDITCYKYELREYYVLYKEDELPNYSPMFGSSPQRVNFINFYNWYLYSKFRKKHLKKLEKDERVKNEKLFAKQVQRDIDTYQTDNGVTLDIDIKYLSD